MLRLAHISDLHYTEDKRQRVTALLETIRRAGINHLIVTGDLTADARQEHMTEVRNLLYSHGYSDSSSLTVIPGNHDLFGFIYQTFSGPKAVVGHIRSAGDMWRTAKTLWHFRKRLLAYGEKAYEQDLCSFRSQFAPAYENTLEVSGARGGFPFIKLLPDNVALIGVDSSRYVPRSYGMIKVLSGSRQAAKTWDLAPIGENLSGSTGHLDYETTKAALETPEVKDRRKIVVMHHYLYPLTLVGNSTSDVFAREMRLMNRDEISELFISHHVDLVLHGHWHIDDAYQLDGALGPKVLNAGGSLWSGFNRIEVENNKVRFAVGARN